MITRAERHPSRRIRSPGLEDSIYISTRIDDHRAHVHIMVLETVYIEAYTSQLTQWTPGNLRQRKASFGHS
jgi:hypothetical protein